MTTQYENQGGLLVKPGTAECAGYIFNFAGHGAYGPEKIDTKDGGPTQAEIDTHNSLLASAEREHMMRSGIGTFYLSSDKTGHRVSQWTGEWRAPFVKVRCGYSYGFCRVQTHWIWFTGPDGKQWYGINKGDQQSFTGRRLKKQ